MGNLAWPLIAGLALGGPRDSTAHEPLAACVQHRLQLTVGARYLDLTLDLTFFEEWSARERRAMDADGNGRITRSESEAYLKKLAPVLAQQLRLRVAGRELELVPLYDPELDLLVSNQTGPGHHRLRLWFFASPAALRAGDEIVVEDGLWPQAPALATLQVEGRDGCALEAGTPGDPGFAPALPGQARLFHARCLKAPRVRNVERRAWPCLHPLLILILIVISPGPRAALRLGLGLGLGLGLRLGAVSTVRWRFATLRRSPAPRVPLPL